MVNISKNNNITWLSILRGLTIALVVCNHVRLLNIETGDCYDFIFEWSAIFQPLRMPTFVFVSGALLYLTRIQKRWNILSLYKDKLVRIGLPLITCTILGCISQMVFNSFVKHPKIIDFSTFLYSFVEYESTPWPHRWYLSTLLFLMALYPLYVIITNKGKWIESISFFSLFILSLFDFRQYVETNWCYFFSLNKYLPFFFFGILSFKYKWWKYVSSSYACFFIWLIYIGLYAIQDNNLIIPYILQFVGISAMVSTCQIISTYIPSLFSSFRNYIFQIYLFGIAFQAFVELIVWRKIGCPDQLVYVFYFINALAGIYLPVLLCKIIERIPNKFIKNCIGLK